MSERASISKRLRFEVFKRDSFKCQYCGRSAPEVVLHVDHIVPVSEGGSNDMLNLITSCESCNLGKSNIELSDNSAVVKRKKQADELQERREQMQMMIEWQMGLSEIEEMAVSEIEKFWYSLAPGYKFNEYGLMSRADLDGPILRSQYAELDRDRAHEDYRLAKVTVERLTGSEALLDESIPDHVPKIVFPRDRLAALSDHFDATAPGSGVYRLEVARLRVEQEKLNYAIIDKNLRPKFNFVTGVSQDEVGYTGSPADKARTQSFFGGININWAVFDGFSTSAQRRASRLRIRQLKAEQTEREREQDEVVKNQVRQLEFSARGAALSEHTLDQANEMVRAKENDVKLGLAAQGEIEGVKLSRDATQIQTMAVRNDLLGRIAEFISSVGRDPALQTFPPSPP